jgi:proteasome assembly chaperone (PAC2) family protein
MIVACSVRANGGRDMVGDLKNLNKPWLVAVWPGMGNVAISAGYFLVAKLGMHILAEFSALELFDVEHVEVKGGLIRMARLPRSRFFVWKDPRERHDIVVFIGEAQPPKGRYAFCQRLVEFARQLGIERVYTFAAMATQMLPEHASRVFGAATDAESLAELKRLELEVAEDGTRPEGPRAAERALKRLELEILEDGQIGGLNGVLLGVAAESGLRGTCLLGEMPHIFAQLPFPKASLAVLEVFSTIAHIDIDLSELSEQAREVEHKLGELLEKVKEALEEQQDQESSGEEEAAEFEPAALEDGPSPEDRDLIERLFRQARKDRSKAYELKRELDRLQLYREYEDRFLDLFKKPG